MWIAVLKRDGELVCVDRLGHVFSDLNAEIEYSLDDLMWLKNLSYLYPHIGDLSELPVELIEFYITPLEGAFDGKDA